jgi:hypothetical protein
LSRLPVIGVICYYTHDTKQSGKSVHSQPPDRFIAMRISWQALATSGQSHLQMPPAMGRPPGSSSNESGILPQQKLSREPAKAT